MLKRFVGMLEGFIGMVQCGRFIGMVRYERFVEMEEVFNRDVYL